MLWSRTLALARKFLRHVEDAAGTEDRATNRPRYPTCLLLQDRSVHVRLVDLSSSIYSDSTPEFQVDHVLIVGRLGWSGFRPTQCRFHRNHGKRPMRPTYLAGASNSGSMFVGQWPSAKSRSFDIIALRWQAGAYDISEPCDPENVTRRSYQGMTGRNQDK